MRGNLTSTPLRLDTVAEMRELYRAAESRAARMRLLSVSGRELAEAAPITIAASLQKSADRLAFFLGSRSATVSEGGAGEGVPIVAPGPARVPIARIRIEGIACVEDIHDSEDREAAIMHLELLGATIDRIARERERGELLFALRDREKRLEHLVGKLFSVQEEERRRVSQELHDGVAQTATALVRILEGAGTSTTGDIPAAKRGHLAGIARDLVRELRAVIGGLRPTLLDDLGLEAALQSLADGLQAEGYTVTCDLGADSSRLPAHVETALFRVAQEALSNVRKHAGSACKVVIELKTGDDGTGRILRIRDTGSGPADGAPGSGATPAGTHVGIDVMHERMAAIGGQLDWRAGSAGGVTVTARLPEGL
jgi:hypothetical protein